MKLERAAHHLQALAESCADMSTKPASIFPLRVVQLWVFGDVLEAPPQLERVTVALVVDLPDIPWYDEPPGSQHWANAVRLPQNPIQPFWRSARAPVWNHRIIRPLLLWDIQTGIAVDAPAVIAAGRAESVRAPAPTADELAARLDDEMAHGFAAVRERAKVYEERRWAPGKLTPVADALWRVTAGYLDVRDAVHGLA